MTLAETGAPSRRTRSLALLAALLLSAPAMLAASSVDEAAAIHALFDEWRYAEAETRARAMLAAAEAAHGADSLEAARALGLLVDALWHEAEASRATTRGMGDRGDGEVDFGGTWRAIDAAEAVGFAERALAITMARFGGEHAEVADSLDRLGSLLRSQGRHEDARRSIERALTIRRSVQGPGHVDVSKSLSELALILRRSGDYEGARRHYEDALAIRERSPAPDPVEVARSRLALASLAGQLGDPERERQLAEQVVHSLRGRDQQMLAIALRGLAGVLLHAGDFDGSARAADEATDVQRQVGPRHPRMVGCLIGAGNARAETGDFARARELLERAASIAQETRGSDDPVHAWALNNLGEMLTLAGEYESAQEATGRALAIYERVYGPTHPQTETALCPLAEATYLGGDPVAAKALLGTRFDGYERDASSANPSALWCTMMYASLLRDTGEPERASRLYERLVASIEMAFGPGHPHIATLLRERALLSLSLGDEAAAFSAALRLETITRDHLRVTSRGLSERAALLYAARRTTGLDLALSLAGDFPDAASRRSLLDSVIRSRAVVLDEMAARRRAAGETPEVASLSRDLASVTQRLANLRVRGPGPISPEHYRTLLDRTREERERIETDLAAKSEPFREQRARTKLGLGDVVGVLPTASALVSYVYHERIQRPEASSGADSSAPRGPVPSYTALVVRGRGDRPDVVPLGDATEIDARVERWRSAIFDEPSRRATETSPAAALARERASRTAGASLLAARHRSVGRATDPAVAALAASLTAERRRLANLMVCPACSSATGVERGPFRAQALRSVGRGTSSPVLCRIRALRRLVSAGHMRSLRFHVPPGSAPASR